MFFAINVVQFVFIAFKLDHTLQWNWVVVFVPTWVLFSLGIVGTLYSLILSAFLTRSMHALQYHRRAQVRYLKFYGKIIGPIRRGPFITCISFEKCLRKELEGTFAHMYNRTNDTRLCLTFGKKAWQIG